jgi:hypothetical protein
VKILHLRLGLKRKTGILIDENICVGAKVRKKKKAEHI